MGCCNIMLVCKIGWWLSGFRNAQVLVLQPSPSICLFSCAPRSPVSSSVSRAVLAHHTITASVITWDPFSCLISSSNRLYLKQSLLKAHSSYYCQSQQNHRGLAWKALVCGLSSLSELLLLIPSSLLPTRRQADGIWEDTVLWKGIWLYSGKPAELRRGKQCLKIIILLGLGCQVLSDQGDGGRWGTKQEGR